MNNKLLTSYLLILLFLCDFAVFADPGDDFEPEPDAAPINSKLIVLAIAGILFAIYTLRKHFAMGKLEDKKSN